MGNYVAANAIFLFSNTRDAAVRVFVRVGGHSSAHSVFYAGVAPETLL